jgi:hypothetical protein
MSDTQRSHRHRLTSRAQQGAQQRFTRDTSEGRMGERIGACLQTRLTSPIGVRWFVLII